MVTGARYPTPYGEFVAILGVSNMNIGGILEGFWMFDLGYYENTLFGTLEPVAIFSVLVGVYMIAGRKNHHSQVAMRTVKRRHLYVVHFIASAVYLPVSSILLQGFSCQMLDDGISYLVADTSLRCTTSKHRAFMVYISVMLLVYTVGIPVLSLWCLSQNRDIVQKGSSCPEDFDKLNIFESLWEPYKPQVYYFELVEYARRLTLTGLLIFLFPETSTNLFVIAVLLSVLFWLVSEVLSPFHSRFDAWLYRAGTFMVFVSMYLPLLSEVGVSSGSLSSLIMITIHVGLFLEVLSQFILSMAKRVGRVAR